MTTPAPFDDVAPVRATPFSEDAAGLTAAEAGAALDREADWCGCHGYNWVAGCPGCPSPRDRRVNGSTPLLLLDPLSGALCHFCGATADDFHVSDELWASVEDRLGQHQACFKCFRIAAWHAGVRSGWEVTERPGAAAVVHMVYACPLSVEVSRDTYVGCGRGLGHVGPCRPPADSTGSIGGSAHPGASRV